MTLTKMAAARAAQNKSLTLFHYGCHCEDCFGESEINAFLLALDGDQVLLTEQKKNISRARALLAEKLTRETAIDALTESL